MKILFFSKKDDEFANKAAAYTKLLFPETIVFLGSRGDQFPNAELDMWKGDYIFSYLSPWIIPNSLLENAGRGSINWHPGTPRYPGIGCTNFAIYNDEKEFGITCHFMKKKVDTGAIIEVRRFSILENDTVYSVTQKCYAHILSSYYGILEKIFNNQSIELCGEEWEREPYTRKELNALCKIELQMSREEVDKRIKSTTYDRPWAYTIIQGRKFYWKG
jgi:methionyl-tRNA formyltransferase